MTEPICGDHCRHDRLHRRAPAGVAEPAVPEAEPLALVVGPVSVAETLVFEVD